MSTSTATALADTLPSSVPKLNTSGLNWAIFSLRFQDTVEAKGFWGHFDGTTPCPNAVTTTTATATVDDTAAVTVTTDDAAAITQ